MTTNVNIKNFFTNLSPLIFEHNYHTQVYWS